MRMKTLKQSSAQAVLLSAAALGLLWVGGPAFAQTFTTLKSFGILTNVSGFYPNAPLVQGADGTLYGMASAGEGSVRGTVFRMQPDGNGFTVLKWFTNGLEGTGPYGGLALSGDTLYGATSQGGSVGAGTLFKVETNGTGFAVLKEFTGTDGASPQGGLTLSGSTLYGTTTSGGGSGNGTLFKLNTDGTSFTVLMHLGGTNGSGPSALTLAGNVFYVAAYMGGSSDAGTVFYRVGVEQ
jgi:uncharacterized repeat protein (TIGR03803 family)